MKPPAERIPILSIGETDDCRIFPVLSENSSSIGSCPPWKKSLRRVVSCAGRIWIPLAQFLAYEDSSRRSRLDCTALSEPHRRGPSNIEIISVFLKNRFFSYHAVEFRLVLLSWKISQSFRYSNGFSGIFSICSDLRRSRTSISSSFK